MTVAEATGRAIVEAHFAASRAASSAFFDTHAALIASACERLADRFARGGTLFVVGRGAQASDAHHVSVEFVHPVIVGKRALPAVALTSEAALSSADGLAASLRSLARPGDILLLLSGAALDTALGHLLIAARQRGLLTLALTAEVLETGADVTLPVAAANPLVVQEVHETTYHVLWELVHVFLDQAEAAAPGRTDPTAAERALYPFLFSGADGRGLDGVRREVEASIRAKSADVCALRAAVQAIAADDIARAGAALAARIAGGGRLLTFGNGGSATDAEDAAIDCLCPPVAGWWPMPALALTNDIGIVTAVANDVGFDRIFARQIAAFGGPDDVAIGISTSGMSRSVLSGLEAAKARRLLTIALVGGQGGDAARSPAVDICLTAPSDYTPRIQEAHATIWHALLSAAQGVPR